MSLLDIFRIRKIKEENEQLKQTLKELQIKMDSLGVTEYYEAKERIEKMEVDSKNQLSTLKQNAEETLKTLNTNIEQSIARKNELQETLTSFENKNTTLEKQINTNRKKLTRTKELYKSMENSINSFFELEPSALNLKLPNSSLAEAEELAPSVILKLHYMDVKDLRKAYKENDKQIEQILTKYASRYTTKSNKAAYQLMVLALRSELQNILYSLKYDKLEDSIEHIKNLTKKYLDIVANGDQRIAGTITKFIGEIEYLFINAIKIEYNYYVKKEQARQEQLAIREQMRQEAEERKALEAEKKKIEKEEAKFKNEIDNLTTQLSTALPDEIQQLNDRILELQNQLSNVASKKDEISNLQNGKAGNVYVISNLGAFGDNIFKIGMTRRLDPQDRINELGSASVPFKFDVHSFIFSDDAVSLENRLHKELDSKRLNKVNMRKEFFKISLDELEKLVTEIAPTAEFNKTMLAEEYHQSLSSDENYIIDSSQVTDFDESIE